MKAFSGKMVLNAWIAAGPMRENHSPCRKPPVTNTLTPGRLVSSMATFTVLVTTVTSLPSRNAPRHLVGGSP